MDSTNEFYTENLIYRMFQLGARTPIVKAATGINEKSLRSQAWKITGQRPTAGRQPSDPEFYFRDEEFHLHTTIAASHIRALALDTEDSVSVKTVEGGHLMCDAYDNYAATMPDRLIDFTHFVLLITSFMREGRFLFERCTSCTQYFLVHVTKNRHPCPFCAIERRIQNRNCRTCGSALDRDGLCKQNSCPRGRRRKQAGAGFVLHGNFTSA